MGDVIKFERCRHSVIDKLGRKLVCSKPKHPGIEVHRLVLPSGSAVGDRPSSQGTVPHG